MALNRKRTLFSAMLGSVILMLPPDHLAKESGIEIAGVILNHSKVGPPSDIERELSTIIKDLGVPVLGECPFIDPISKEQFNDKLAEKIKHWKIL